MMKDKSGGMPSALCFGREICSDLAAAEQREWLVTNGLGGYASGTVAGLLTRRYHGLLVAALPLPHGRTLLLTKLDEVASYEGQEYVLFCNRWLGGEVEPAGYRYLERFRLEGTTPVWSYAFQDALLEKRIWMEPGANTTYVRYDLLRGTAPLALSAKAIVNYRDHHGNTRAGDWRPGIKAVPGGLRVGADLYLLSAGAAATRASEWYRGYWLSREAYRGLDAADDNLCAGRFDAVLSPGDSLTLVASTGPAPALNGGAAYARRQARETRLLAQSGLEDAPARVRQLVLAADQFIVRRAVGDDPDGRSIIAGYHWFTDWGRDTMISLPGLTLATGRTEVATAILRTYAAFVDQGMLPNRFPDGGELPGAGDYNTVDATLWYFEAIRAYHAETLRCTQSRQGDDDLLRNLCPVLQEIVRWHVRGTRYGIRMDPVDGLLFSGEAGVQLTWMDAKVGDWVVTPRTGKAVEINALWYNALCTLAEITRHLGEPAGHGAATEYEDMAERVQASFGRFWNDTLGYCYDVVDGPAGDDASLRPNQLLAVSLHHSPLTRAQQRAVIDACARHLLTSHGLRSLTPGDPAYVGHYGGDRRQRDAAYHQGTVWAWLIGPFVSAHLRVYGDRALARSYLKPLLDHLSGGCVGSISEIFDGDPPYAPRGAIAQAWSVAEVLRAWRATA